LFGLVIAYVRPSATSSTGSPCSVDRATPATLPRRCIEECRAVISDADLAVLDQVFATFFVTS
jgi:hypothetical protein